MGRFDYPISLEPAAEGGFVVTFPDVPGAITEGDTEGEALAMGTDALETILAATIDDGKALPKPKIRKGMKVVRPRAISCMKLAAYEAMYDQRLSKTVLAKKLGWHLPQIDRVLDLYHASKIEQVEAMLAALGLVVRVDVAKAA